MSDVSYQIEGDMPPVGYDEPTNDNTPATDEKADVVLKKQVTQWIRKIKEDKRFHNKAFKRMRRDMRVAFQGWDGEDDNWNEKLYVANISGRHVKQKTAQLYAKNPRITAERRETMDFTIWDENPDSLKTAFETVNMATQAMQGISAQMQAQPPQIHPVTGQVMPPQMPQIPPQVQQAVQMANETIQDYQQGMTRRMQVKKMGKTLEILFANAMRIQRPIAFKKGMKGTVRRTCTTGVGYLELQFERQMGQSPLVQAELKDARARFDHLSYLMKETKDGDIQPDDPEYLELEQTMASLENKKDIVLVEGLVFDYPASTRVIPDKLTTSLDGFVGATRMTIEYLFTCQQVEEKFGCDLKKGEYKGYDNTLGSDSDGDSANYVSDDDDIDSSKRRKRSPDMVLVWKIYDKLTGNVFYVADGYDKYLRDPAPPDVTVPTFWPLWALTFNETESEDDLFPMSDVALMRSQQKSINSSRQGKAEHRTAARPRWMGKIGALEEKAKNDLKKMKPFDLLMVNVPDGMKIEDMMAAMKIPGVDPNLYDTGEVWNDVQTVVGSQQSSFGGLPSGDTTATAVQFSAGQADAADNASVDELNDFLSMIAQAGGAVLLRETSPEKVLEIAGPGAFWPDLDNEQIMDEIFLQVEAGSMGKPNQALELANFQKMMPFLMQMPNIAPWWLARETVRRLDDDVDLTEALSSGTPSIVAQNALHQAAAAIGGPAPGGAAPAPPPGGAAGGGPMAQGPQGVAQGPQGHANGPAPPPQAQAGSQAPMGSNHLGVFG